MNKRSKPKYVFLILLLLFSLAYTYIFYIQNKGPSDEDLQKLSFLNNRYGLLTSETLEAEPQKIASIFSPSTLRADLLSSQNPQQEVVIKLKNSQVEADTHLLTFKTKDSLESIISDYQSLNFVELAEPNYEIDLDYIDRNKPVKKRAKVVRTIKRPPEKATSILVAVIDSGADLTHPDLQGRLVKGWDFMDDIPEVTDDLGHGTHIAGIITGDSKYAKVMPLRFTDGKKGKLSNLIKALKYAHKNHAQVVNLSLGLKSNSEILQATVKELLDDDVIVVASSGNNNSNVEYYPAAWEKVFAISALDDNSQKLSVSNYGEWVDYSIDGQDVQSASPGGKYAFYTGTSQAAAKVTAKIVNILARSLYQMSEPMEGPYAGKLGRKF